MNLKTKTCLSRLAFATLLFLFFTFNNAYAFETIQGTVRDLATDNPLEGIKVKITIPGYTTTRYSDANGYWTTGARYGRTATAIVVIDEGVVTPFSENVTLDNMPPDPPHVDAAVTISEPPTHINIAPILEIILDD